MGEVDDVEGLLEAELTSEDIDTLNTLAGGGNKSNSIMMSSSVNDTAADIIDGNSTVSNLESEAAANSPPQNHNSSLLSDSALLDDSTDDPELEAIKARVREMEQEQLKLKQMQEEVEKHMNSNPSGLGHMKSFPTTDEKMDADMRSIYVGNVDYSSTAEELEQHFNGCGAINRVTILCDKFTGQPKGFAYIEFSEKDSVETAQALNDSLFKGRTIKVVAKRFNVPGVTTTNRGGFRGRGRGIAPYRGGGGYRGGFGGYRPVYRGRGMGFRPRRNWYSPY